MKNKETGEFELIVGDKQLLSGFFIGVVLLAVVFAMGYVLGNNSPKSAKVAPETAASATSTPPVEAHPETPSPGPVPSTEPAPSDSTATQPAQTADTAQPPAAASAPAPAEAPPQPTTVPAHEVSPPAAAASAPPPAAKPAPDPANAMYWQVTAASSPNSADAMLQSLKGRGFPVSARPGPKNLTLVWVGPYYDKESLARARKQLQDAGIKPIKKP
jgi:hypothetical protein